jgi:hypothetical protein
MSYCNLHNHSALKHIKNQFSISMYRCIRSLHRCTYSKIKFFEKQLQYASMHISHVSIHKGIVNPGIDASIVCIDTMKIFKYLASIHNSLHRYSLLSSELNAYFFSLMHRHINQSYHLLSQAFISSSL